MNEDLKTKLENLRDLGEEIISENDETDGLDPKLSSEIQQLLWAIEELDNE